MGHRPHPHPAAHLSCRFLRRWCELDDLSAQFRRNPLQLFPEVIWYVELDYFCHGSPLPSHLIFHMLFTESQSAFGRYALATPSRTDTGRNRSSSAFSKEPYKLRMTSSTLLFSKPATLQRKPLRSYKHWSSAS